MKAEFYLDGEMIELRKNIICCPRKGEIVTFDGKNFFEVTEVVNDFSAGRFALQVEERPDFEYFRIIEHVEEVEEDNVDTDEYDGDAAEDVAEETDIDDNFEYDDDLDDDYDEE